jgi:hypothetical protein
VIGSQAQFVLDQFRALGAQRQAEAAYRGWLLEIEAQVPAGACIVSFDAAEAIYSNHTGFAQWTVFSDTKTPQDLRLAMQAENCGYLIASRDLRDAVPGFMPIAEQVMQPLYTGLDQTRTIYRLP